MQCLHHGPLSCGAREVRTYCSLLAVCFFLLAVGQGLPWRETSSKLLRKQASSVRHAQSRTSPDCPAVAPDKFSCLDFEIPTPHLSQIFETLKMPGASRWKQLQPRTWRGLFCWEVILTFILSRGFGFV